MFNFIMNEHYKFKTFLTSEISELIKHVVLITHTHGSTNVLSYNYNQEMAKYM